MVTSSSRSHHAGHGSIRFSTRQTVGWQTKRCVCLTRRDRTTAVSIPRVFLLGFVLSLGILLVDSTKSNGQGVRGGTFGQLGGVEPDAQYPSPQYYLALEIYRTGNLAAASDAFEQALRLARREVRGRWIDSIPPLAMMAECQWQLGNLVGARDYVDQAIQIAIMHRGWLSRIDWVGMLQANQQTQARSYLWPQAKAVRRAPVANRVMFQSGQLLTEQTLLQGGAIEELNIRPMDMVEIMRGLAIACYRRRVLMGRLSEQDALIQSLLESTTYPANLPVPIGRTLIGSMRVSEYHAYHDDRSVTEESPSMSLYSGATHPLSSIVLLSQIASMIELGQQEAVLSLALQATHFAGAWEQVEWIGEALQLAAGCASTQQAVQVRQIAEVVAQSISRYSPLCAYHSLIAGADASITAGDLENADRLINQMNLFGSRRDFLQPRLDAYAAYVTARYAAATGGSTGLDQPSVYDLAIGNVVDFAFNHRFRSRPLISMPYLYQVGLVQSAMGKQLGGTSSEKLLREYCQDPGLTIWRRDPVDAIAGLLMDRTTAQIARMNLAVNSGFAESFLLTWNELLTSRFLRDLPLNGRILQVRRLAGVPDQQLTPSLIEQRQKMGPKMVRLLAEARALPKEAQPNLAAINLMESRATQLALERIEIPQVTPPRLLETTSTKTIPDKTAMITFTILGNQLIGTVSTSTKVRMWIVGPVSKVTRDLSGIINDFGVGRLRGNRLPEEPAWRERAVQLRDYLFQNSDVVFTEYEEIVFVPDGPLWYLPFEILPFPEHATDLFVDRLKIRYAPTPGFAIKLDQKPTNREPKVAISADLFFAPRDLEKNEATIDELLGLLPETIRLPDPVGSPSCFLGSTISDLIVARPQFVNPKNPLAFHPAGYDQGLAMGTVKAWLRFPTAAPSRLVMKGFRTPVDGGQMAVGDELFRTLCAIHSSGVQEVLVSRWAVGGQSSAILARELIKALPDYSLSDAWRAAREVLQGSDLEPEDEPLLTKAEHGLKGLTGTEPLFWSGYLLSAPAFEKEKPNP